MVDKLEGFQRASSQVSKALAQYRGVHGDDLPEVMDWPFGSSVTGEEISSNPIDETAPNPISEMRVAVADMNLGMRVRLHWKSGDKEEGEITGVDKAAHTFSYREHGKKLSHSVRMPPDHDGLWVEQLPSDGHLSPDRPLSSDAPRPVWQPSIDHGSVTYVPAAPPCGYGCTFWAPRRDNSINSGIRCCWAPPMESDFSCYKPRE
jgi:hypothetical protein